MDRLLPLQGGAVACLISDEPYRQLQKAILKPQEHKMEQNSVEALKTAIQSNWPQGMSEKAKRLDSLLQDLKSQGISQKDFAESIGMNPRHLSSIKSSEMRNRYYNELGATKLACLWVLEHVSKT